MTNPSDPLQQQLQERLRGAYLVERELSGAGMSRVFVATETSLDRRVAVKVLPHELAAAVSIDRFRREVHLAAQLQHPHIVPLLAAGDADGLLYYTMPYVEGESLRARLGQARMSMSEVVLVLRDVLNALSYAHRRGVIHRDIKPDNILLSEGGAMVTDFGIAKALHAAHDESVTGIGVVVGTPAYAAPEQAVADPTVDHRADLYSLGAVAYEMLCGESPFGGRAPRQQLAAHAMEIPQEIGARSPEAPAGLAALVMRCLEKDVDRRPQDAQEILKELDDLASAAGSLRAPVARVGRRWRVAGAAAASVAVLLGATFAFVPRDLLASVRTLITRRPPLFLVNRVVVAPFENQSGDSTLSSLGVMAADWIAEGLSGLPNLQVVDARTALATGKIVNEIPWPLRRLDRGRALAEETGSGLLVTGTFYKDRDTLRFQARISDASTGRLQTMLPMVSGPASAPTRVLEDLRRPIVGTLRSAADSVVSKPLLSYSTPPSFEAYDAVIRGLEAYFTGDTAVFTHFERSARLDSTYVTPVVLLAFSRWYRSYPAVVDTLLRRIDRFQNRMSPAERAMADHIRALMRADGNGAVRAAEDFVRVTPGSMESPLLLASTSLTQRRPRLALSALSLTSPDRGLNLVGGLYWLYLSSAYAQMGDWRRALSISREARRRFPNAAGPAGSELRALVELGRMDEVRENIRTYPDRFGTGRVAAAARTINILDALGRDADARAIADEWRPRLDAMQDTTFRVRNTRLLFAMSVRDWPTVLQFADAQSGPSAPYDIAATRAVASIRLGRPEEARRAESILAGTTARFSFGAIPLARARIAAHFGEGDRGIVLLRQAIAEGAYIHNVMPIMQFDPLLAPLRDLPTFAELLAPREGQR